MLLENNTQKVINLLNQFDNLKDIDKIRLAIYLLENINFNMNNKVNEIIELLNKILLMLDNHPKKVIINFSKYTHLLYISSKYLELSIEEQKHFIIEMLFNIYENDFNNELINTLITNKLFIYDYCFYLIFNK